MIEKSLRTSFFLLLMPGFIKATTLGMKLFIMAAAGLAGMYMMHLLAQDYNRYQTLNRPGRSVSNIFKRSLPDDVSSGWFHGFNKDNATTPKSLLEEIKSTEEFYKRNQLFSFDRILQFDPTGCARRYLCTIASKSSKKLSAPEKNIIRMLRNLPIKSISDSGQAAFRFALNLGRLKKDAQACAEEYPKCMFSISQMLKLVGFS